MIFKRGKVYWYEFVFACKRYRGTTKILIGRGVPGEVTPKEKAKQVESAKRTKLALAKAGIVQREPAPMFEKFTERFLKWVAVEKADKPRTVEFYKTEVRLLLKFDAFKGALLDEIDEAMIAKYVESRRGSMRTLVRRRGSASNIARQCELSVLVR